MMRSANDVNGWQSPENSWQTSQIYTRNRLPQLFDELDVAVIVVGRNNGQILYINNHVCRDVGKTHAELENKHYRKVFWPEFISVYDQLAASCEDGFGHSAIFYWAEMAIWEQISARMVIWETEPALLICITNINEVTLVEHKFENMAYFDNVLKLPNGAKLEEDISELADVEAVALICFSVERFEEINNLYGWDSGDYLLKQISDWIISSESNRAQLYRIDNGFAIMGRWVMVDGVIERAEEILQRFRQPWALSAGGNVLSVFCTIKLGIVYGKYIQNEMRNLLSRTIRIIKDDVGYAIYDEEADKQEKRNLMLRDALINCIYNDMRGFEVHYQPIVDTKTERWVGVEALCRWTLPNGTKVPPGEFIHIAEQIGLVVQIDRWVGRKAMADCVMLGLNKKRFKLSINFSPTHTVSNRLAEDMAGALKRIGYPAEKLNIEITESAKMSFEDDNLNGLRLLNEQNISLSLDDFGTGYSSFENLIGVPVGSLKIEKMFLDGIETDGYKQYLLQMLVDLAHHLDMKLISEGVETKEQLALMKKYGVDLVQGYYFSKPISYDALQQEVWRFGDDMNGEGRDAPQRKEGRCEKV
ncbi:MAG: EAL domain-containing protein [Christensenellaceae bacterium]|jgi:PAS domain S-box-containing protein